MSRNIRFSILQQQEAARRARQDAAAAKKAQEDAAAATRKAQQDAAAAAAAKKAQQDAAAAAATRKAQQDAAAAAAKKAQQDSAAAAAKKAQDAAAIAVAKSPETLKNVSAIGSEIKKQKEKVDENIKILTSAAITGSGLLAGGLASLAKSSKDMKNKQTISTENRTSVKNLYVIMPDINTNKKYIKNPDYKQFVKDYGTQIVPYKFYNKDTQLTEYEKFFNDNKSACVPMALAVNYFSQIQNNDE